MPKTKFQWRHQYDEERDAIERAATDTVNTEPSLTQQQFTEEVDLNIMVKRMGLTDGSIPAGAMDPALFGDFTDATDLRDVFDRTRAAHEMFAQLPADIRRKFDHNPAEMLEFVLNPKNHKEAVSLGLLQETAPEAPPLGSKERPIHTVAPDPTPKPA